MSGGRVAIQAGAEARSAVAEPADRAEIEAIARDRLEKARIDVIW